MKFLDYLERRFGAWAIPEFPLFIVAANGVIYILSLIRVDFLYRLVLDVEAVHQGEWWRLVTFLFVPPMMGPIWEVFWLYLLFLYARTLEEVWGGFQFCLFYGVGALATIITAMWIVGENLSNVPLNTTLFLAFATLFPDFELLLFFILPVKVKYLAWVVWIGILWGLLLGTGVTRAAIGASLVNYALFMGPHHFQRIKLWWHVRRNRRHLL